MIEAYWSQYDIEYLLHSSTQCGKYCKVNNKINMMPKYQINAFRNYQILQWLDALYTSQCHSRILNFW